MNTRPRLPVRLLAPLTALALSVSVAAMWGLPGPAGASSRESRQASIRETPQRLPALRILVAVEGEREDVRAGIALGEAESRQTLRLVERSLDVEWARAEDLPNLRTMLASARVGGHTAVIVALDPGEHEVAWDRAGLPVLAVMPVDTASPWLFRMRAEPGTQEWQPSLERFGAGDLNSRFHRATGRPMTSDAWCGWVAVKAIAEAAPHARSTSPADVADALRVLRFDGHKGEPLYFDAQQQLVQPVYDRVY